MDLFDRKLLTALQSNFPFSTRPFKSIARSLGTDEKTVLSRTNQLKQQGIIRQISAIFDSEFIGYQSTLAAFKVPDRDLESVAAFVSAHAGVSHNYSRKGAYNLWFTLTLPAGKDLKTEIRKMAHDVKVADWLFLPALKTFKINFQLDFTGKAGSAPPGDDAFSTPSTRCVAKTPRRFVRELQKDLPIVSRPYRRCAAALEINESKVVDLIKKHTGTGAVRRVAAVLRQKKAGFTANVMVAWAPRENLKKVLAGCAIRKKEISHCYERPWSSTWPYSIYTMVHGRTMGECTKVIEDMSAQSGVKKYRVLPTIREFKKTRVLYFPEDSKIR